MASNPYLVVRRILDTKNKLWGVKVKLNNQYYKMAKERLKEIIQHDIRPVNVDLPNGGDAPVTLTLYNEQSFRTIKDGHLCNNFNKIKAIKLVTANKLKILK